MLLLVLVSNQSDKGISYISIENKAKQGKDEAGMKIDDDEVVQPRTNTPRTHTGSCIDRSTFFPFVGDTRGGGNAVASFQLTPFEKHGTGAPQTPKPPYHSFLITRFSLSLPGTLALTALF